MTRFHRFRRASWRALYRYRWPGIGILAVVSFGLGAWGFHDYYVGIYQGRPPRPQHIAAPDLVYVTLALFRDTVLLYYAKKGPPFPPALEVAHFLAPFTLVLAGVSALVAVFSEPFNLLRIRLLYRRHLVVCGLGQFGQRLATAFDALGRRVVVVDCDPSSVALSVCRSRFMPVVKADAVDPEVLRRAGVHRARHLVVVCGDNSVNAEIGMAAKRLAEAEATTWHPFRRRARTVDCFIHVDDDQLCQILEQAGLTKLGNSGEAQGVGPRVSVNYVNVFRSGPVALLRKYPDYFAERDGKAPHIVVVGTDRIGLLLVVGAVREWWFDHRGQDLRLRLTLVAPDAPERAATVRQQYPHFDESCDLVTHAFDPAGPRSAELPALERDDGWQLSTVFVCYPDETATLEATLRLARALPTQVPIVAVNTGQNATVTLLDIVASDLHFPNVSTFPLLDRVCQPEVFVNTVTEQVAQALHEKFLEDRKRDATFDPAKPSHRPWEELEELYRESNRDQAGRYGKRLELAGYAVELTDEWDVAMPAFTDADIDGMAKVEHERWCEWSWANGWVYASVLDVEHRRHPDLTPWEQLSGPSKEKDLEIVRELPEVLARYGLAIVPGSPTA